MKLRDIIVSAVRLMVITLAALTCSQLRVSRHGFLLTDRCSVCEAAAEVHGSSEPQQQTEAD